MRYPERNKSDSSVVNISDTQSVRFPSSSTTDSQDLFENDDSIPNANGDEAGNANNVATISEHVLFGNNNGHNSFLYLFYSSSTTSNETNPNNNSRRPYTTGGGAQKGGYKTMGSSMQQWNDLSGEGGRRSKLSSAGPSPVFYNQEDGNEFHEKKVYGSKGLLSPKSEDSGHQNDNDNTPYPVYLSPIEGSPVLLASSPASASKSKSSGSKVYPQRDQRLDAFAADLLDEDDWEKIYSVPDVDPRYILSPSSPPNGTSRKIGNAGTGLGSTSHATKNYNLEVFNDKTSKAASASSLNQAGSIHPNPGGASVKRVRVNPDEAGRGIRRDRVGGNSVKKWSGTGQGKKLSSTTSSSTSSAKSMKRSGGGNPHHQHQPLNNNHQLDMEGQRFSSSATADGLDQMSFRNGIGEYFGTAASRKISHSQEATPEEMYQKELDGWKPRLATAATIFLAVVFIMSCSSLLFVFPILVDPILVGFEAQFSEDPVTCRTTNLRNGSGPSDCAIPSCREGCTLDLFNCTFVDVEYSIPMKGTPRMSEKLTDNPGNISDHFSNTSLPSFTTTSLPVASPKRGFWRNHSGILFININGCGYPPEVTCSDFEKKYARINTEFPCYYSQQNGSIVVPHYNRRTEAILLTLAVCIPVGVALFSGISLYLLVKCQTTLKTKMYKRYASRKRSLRERRRKAAQRQLEDEGHTSLSELEAQDDYDDECTKTPIIHQNGASKTGQEARMMLDSTQM